MTERSRSRLPRLRIAVPAVLAVLALAACSRTGQGPPPGDAPGGAVSCAVKDLSGRTLDLRSLRGKVILVDLWATWCQPCVRSIPGLARLSKLRPDDLAVVGILSGDEPANLERFLARQPIPYFVGVESAETRRFFVAEAFPTVFVVDRDGHVVDRVVGLVPEAELMRRVTPHL